MNDKSLIKGTVEAWESGKLGVSDEHTRRVDPELCRQIDDALGLQAISIRLPKSTIQAYKDVAEIHGVGYQPLMRDAICRWVESEIKGLLSGRVQSQRDAKIAQTKAESSKTSEQKSARRSTADKTRMKKAA